MNNYSYVEGNPIGRIDTSGLVKMTLSGYLGWGGGVSVGMNPDGTFFVEAQPGYGFGGGLNIDPYGQSNNYDPGGDPDGYNGYGGNANAGFGIGPLSVDSDVGGGRNYDSDGNYDGYYLDDDITPTVSIDAFLDWDLNFGGNISGVVSWVGATPPIVIAGGYCD